MTNTKLIYGVGVNDANYIVRPKKGERCPFYEKWQNMLKRCYSQNYQDKNPSYRGVTVCKSWLQFSRFKSWMEGQDWRGKFLDKDLLVKGNKVYSPKTCCFVSPRLNNFNKFSRGEMKKLIDKEADGIIKESLIKHWKS